MQVAVDTDFLVRLSVEEHPHLADAKAIRDRLLDAGHLYALAPQVVSEFIHVVTDPRRFENPLSPEQAIDVAHAWQGSREVVPLLPNERTIPELLDLMQRHRLGRKKILDTLLAATCRTNRVEHLVTSNGQDYALFDFLTIEALR